MTIELRGWTAGPGSARSPETSWRECLSRALASACIAAACMLIAACEEHRADARAQSAVTARGRELIEQYGCGSCHTIPHVDAARGTVGPPLSGIATRTYIAGVLPNTPDNMVAWIRAPPKIDPRTAMPAVGATEEEARAIAAYLYTLK